MTNKCDLQSNELPHDKTNKMACAPSENSDQPGHPPSLIRVFAVRMKKAWVLSYPLSAIEASDQTGRMPRLICVFAGRTCHFLVFFHEAAQMVISICSVQITYSSLNSNLNFSSPFIFHLDTLLGYPFKHLPTCVHLTCLNIILFSITLYYLLVFQHFTTVQEMTSVQASGLMSDPGYIIFFLYAFL